MFWTLGEKLCFSPLRMIFVVGFLYMVFMILRYVPSISTLWRVFIKKGCCILSNAFLDMEFLLESLSP